MKRRPVIHWHLSFGAPPFCGAKIGLFASTSIRKQDITCKRCTELMKLHGHLVDPDE